MKTSLLFLLLCLSHSLYATSPEFAMGGVTYHFMDGGIAHKFSNQLSHDGNLIATPSLGLTWTDDKSFPGEYTSKTVFTALNSVGEPAAGYIFQTGLNWTYVQLGLVMGAYAQDDSKFRARGIAPFVVAEVGSIGLAPVAGVAVNFKLPLANAYFVRFNNIISPIITNHSLNFGKDF